MVSRVFVCVLHFLRGGGEHWIMSLKDPSSIHDCAVTCKLLTFEP